MTSKERHELRYQRRKNERLKNKTLQTSQFKNFENVFSYEKLYKAYKHCRQNVTWKFSTQSYIARAPLILTNTHYKLLNNQFKSEGFKEFDIIERGKKRHIHSVTMNERIVQRCLCDNALVPTLSRTFIYDNSASIHNKGYHFAIRRLTEHLRQHYYKYGSEGYILLFDFSKFFDNVSHSLIKEILHKEFSDEKILTLTEHFVDVFGDCGLGLGSQVSQILALSSANRLDHMIKEKLYIKQYGRYMDDGYLIHKEKAYLKTCLEEIKNLCIELGISLNLKKTQIVKLSHGFTFLKARFYLLPSGKIIKKIPHLSVTKMRRKLKSFKQACDKGKMTLDDVYNSYQSWRSYATHFNAYNTIKIMDSLYKKLFDA